MQVIKGIPGVKAIAHISYYSLLYLARSYSRDGVFTDPGP